MPDLVAQISSQAAVCWEQLSFDKLGAAISAKGAKNTKDTEDKRKKLASPKAFQVWLFIPASVLLDRSAMIQSS
jgi:hypothetical protein